MFQVSAEVNTSHRGDRKKPVQTPRGAFSCAAFEIQSDRNMNLFTTTALHSWLHRLPSKMCQTGSQGLMQESDVETSRPCGVRRSTYLWISVRVVT